MKFRTQKHHVIDFIFPLALFFVFAVSALLVVLMATDIYKSVTNQAEKNNTSRTALAYISEKIRQNDVAGGVSVGAFEGQDSLILKQRIGDNAYTTYIYEYEGRLKELFIKDGAEVSPAAGADIMETSDFEARAMDGSLFYFSIADEDGDRAEIVVGVRSELEDGD